MSNTDSHVRHSSDSTVKVTRGHSCLACYQRKVRCDGKRPCSTCAKNGTECRPATRQAKALRSREAPNATDHDRLLTHLRRCEELLVAHGIDVETHQRTSGDDVSMRESLSPGVEDDDGHMIVQHGHTRFVENALWKGLGNELQFEDDLLDLEEDEQSVLNDELPQTPYNLVLGRSVSRSVTCLHPTVPQILMLWQTFLNNFNPLVKIFHAPSVQSIIYEAINDLKSTSPPNEALLLSIYLSAVTTMNDQECRRLMCESKQALFAKFSNATQQALANAEFLKCTDLVILQALTLYLLASRRYLDSQSLWLLSGLAKRIGQTMGLHRESSLRKLPPFEAEIRRRLWWQLVIMDSRSAQLSGVYVDAAVNTFWDTRRPLNVSDSDLSPYMKELPKERDGPTEMLFCTIRTEIGECIRQLQVMYKNSKVTHVTCLAQKMRLMDECEGRLDQSILKELDLSIPLHLFALYLAKSAFLQMRLSACHPQQYPDRGASLPKEEKDKLFDMALQIIAYDSLTYSNKSLGGYLWHVIMHFPFEAFILVLTELLTRLKGDDVDRAWLRVKQAYEDHPELITEAPKTPLYFALGNLTIKAWDKRMLSTQQEQHLAHRPIMAPAISKLKGQRMSHSSITEPGLQSNAYLADVYSYQGARPPSSSVQPDSGSSVDWNGQHGQFLLTDASDMGWESWNSLLQGAGDHSRFYGDGIGQNFHMG